MPISDLIPKGPGRLGLVAMALYFGWLILLIIVIMLLAIFGVI